MLINNLIAQKVGLFQKRINITKTVLLLIKKRKRNADKINARNINRIKKAFFKKIT